MQFKALVPKEKARDYAYPLEDDLINIDFGQVGDRVHSIALYTCGRELQPFHFAVVVKSCSRHVPHDKTQREVILNLKVSGLEFATNDLLNGCKVTLSVVTSVRTFRRQWSGLINLHTSLLVRDILSPRGGSYFCCQPSSIERGHQHNQVNACVCNFTGMSLRVFYKYFDVTHSSFAVHKAV